MSSESLKNSTDSEDGKDVDRTAGARLFRSTTTPFSSRQAARCELDAYGLAVEVAGEWPEVVEAVALDFAWFDRSRRGVDGSESATDRLEVLVERRPPDFDAWGAASASYVTPQNVVYEMNGRTLVDYFGRALLVLDRGRAVVQGEDRHLVHEVVYLLLLQKIGEQLESRGLMRLHALGLVGAQGALALMLPSGGGKSTMALAALRSGGGVRLLSDDSPLLDRRGRLHPMPLRIGVNPDDAESLPRGQVRRIERMELHPKYALELRAFADRIAEEPVPLRHIVLGRRSLGHEPSLEPIPRVAAVGTLLREGVVGLGIYQGLGFVLQRGPGAVLGKAGLAGARAVCCASALARASTWRLTLGRDTEHNWKVLQPLLER